MSVPIDSPSRTRSPWEATTHIFGRRKRIPSNSNYDENVCHVLEDMVIQLKRIADSLEEN